MGHIGASELSTAIGSFLLALILVVIFLLIIRELNCWYWKINERVSLLKEIRDLLKNQRPPAAIPNVDTPAVSKQPENPVTSSKCYNCGAVVQGDLHGQLCENCKKYGISR